MTDGAHEVVVVTGASGGRGRAVAHAFARRGARIALLARGEDGLDAPRRGRALGGQRAGDAHRRRRRRRGRGRRGARSRSALGPIDVWVNDAMATVFAAFVDTDAESSRARRR